MSTEEKPKATRLSRSDAYLAHPDELIIVVDKSRPEYDERAEMNLPRWMVEDIMHRGVLVPILVRHNGNAPGGTPLYEVVDGRQRVRAARAANKELVAKGQPPMKIKCIPVRGTPDELLEMQIVTNELRQDDDMMTRAAKMQRWIKRGHTEEETAALFKCSKATVVNTLRLLDLHPDVQDCVRKEGLSVTVARELLALPQAEQATKLAEMREAGQLGSRKEATKAAAEAAGPRKMRRKAVRARPLPELVHMRKVLVNASLHTKGLTAGDKQALELATLLLCWAENDDPESTESKDFRKALKEFGVTMGKDGVPKYATPDEKLAHASGGGWRRAGRTAGGGGRRFGKRSTRAC